MNEFDIKAAGWDLNLMHIERSEAIAKQIIERIPLKKSMIAMEFGAGTGITSFLLKDHLGEISMLDNSTEMVKIMNEKIIASGSENLKAIKFDLVKEVWNRNKFDLIFNQMVLHHVDDTAGIINKFFDMLQPGGFLAIADLYPEDGSFHGNGFNGHKGFDPEELSSLLEKTGFRNITVKKCFEINKQITDKELKHFDLFLMVAECGINQVRYKKEY
ncbi:MAG TPA: class I SAM-dependent methyltransferase [Bacteroidales bacterium]|nr:class I SAM-dependent methyltransferase [Bacteroidales bacterium]